MAKLVSFEAKGRSINFYCDARDTRHGFAHDTRMYIDGREVSTGHCYYLNRTWECWSYQTVCLTACDNYLDVRKEDLKDDFKHEYGLSRVCGKRKEELNAITKNDPDVELFTEIKNILRERSF